MQDRDRRRQQFELERSLRKEILCSSEAIREATIASAYERLFREFPDHSVFDPPLEERQRRGDLSAGLIAPLLEKSSRVLEIGCGRGDTLCALTSLGHHVVGVDPSSQMVQLCKDCGLDVRLGTVQCLDFPDESFHGVFCQEVLEHLHPDDVPRFFMEAFRMLRPQGIFSVETPNVTTGPQDISRGFTARAEGLHLKEWAVSELIAQFEATGFIGVKGLLSPQFLARRCATLHRLTHVPARAKQMQDAVLRLVPHLNLRTFFGKCLGLDDIFLFGRKPN